MRRSVSMAVAFWSAAGLAQSPAPAHAPPAAPAPAPIPAAAAAPAADAANLDKVVNCMRANIPQTVRIQTVEITAWDRTGGERTLKGKLVGTRENEHVRVMLKVEAPADLAGASYLVREGDKFDEMYLYLPSVKKVRRITGASLDGQLWGTDLSYNDVKQIENAFTGADMKLEGEGQYEQRPVHLLSFAPRKQDASRYVRIRTQVDQQTCVALQADFLEPAGVRKTLTIKPSAVKQANALWYASEADLRDVRNNTHTRVRVIGVTAGDSLANRYFNPNTFYLSN